MPLVTINQTQKGPATGKFFYTDEERKDENGNYIRRYILPGEAAHFRKELEDVFGMNPCCRILTQEQAEALDLKIINKQVRAPRSPQIEMSNGTSNT